MHKERLLIQYTGKSYRKVLIPEIIELVRIPCPFFKATAVDDTDAIINGGNTDLVWSESHDLTMFLMCYMDRPVLPKPVPLPQDPKWTEGNREMGIGDLR